MNDMLPVGPPGTDEARTIFVRGVAYGIVIGVALGACIALALTRPVEDVVRALRNRLLGDVHEPQFELLN